jgi:hypothetical protein
MAGSLFVDETHRGGSLHVGHDAGVAKSGAAKDRCRTGIERSRRRADAAIDATCVTRALSRRGANASRMRYAQAIRKRQRSRANALRLGVKPGDAKQDARRMKLRRAPSACWQDGG